ncbi:hypothetical protein SmJEL517_g00313 [Synchytrium microbalum]|uniref:Pecanex C-terminal domain-containing protein n=1 Tax=Synchytrium microbalum TaxID=1806994 RepID=A0A507CFE4_9FUNG|nr:uncharacterized protein SmJEL517_g00313 [Synchytrium microbalum]TPX38078.1 hypothetical protein SmJEL517_g00313 [Synchytrium microbalum]
MVAPLLGKYKAKLVLHRYLSTFLGGFRVPYQGTPPFHYLIWLLALFIFWALAELLTATIEDDGIDRSVYFVSITSLIFGVLVGICLVSLWTVGLLLQRRDFGLSSPIDHADEDADLMSLGDSFRFLFQLPKSLLQALCKVVVSVLALPFAMSRLSIGLLPFGNLSVIAHTFGWLSVSIAQWSITSSAPPEPSTTYSTDDWGIDTFSRITHVVVLLALNTIGATYSSTLASASMIILCTLPLLWVLGIIPSLRNLTEWTLEVVNMCLLGGTTMSTFILLTFQVCFASACIAITWALARNSSSATAPFVWMAIICTLTGSRGFNNPYSISGPFIAVELGWTLVRTIIAGVLVGQLTAVSSAAGWIIVGCGAAQYVSYVASQPYVFSILANPLAKITQWRSIQVSQIVVHHATPFLIQCLISTSAFTSASTEPEIWIWIMTFRIMRRAWVNVTDSAVEVAVVFLISLNSSLSDWNNISFVSRCFIVGLLWDRVRTFVNQLWLVGNSWVWFLFSKKQRRNSWPIMLSIGIVTLPITLAIIAIATILDAPLVPLFGLPFVWIGFPRIARFWPNTGSEAPHSADSTLYSSLAPPLLKEISRKCQSRLSPARIGTTYLARQESRILLIRIVSTSFEGITVSLRGLELQGTSCHAVEGRQLDRVFESGCLDSKDTKPKVVLNQDWLSALQPLASLDVETYSDSRFSMVGIMDSPDNLKKLPSLFFKALVWLMFRDADLALDTWKNLPVSRDAIQLSQRQFPVLWWQYLKGRNDVTSEPGVSSIPDLVIRPADTLFMATAAACFCVYLGFEEYNESVTLPDLPYRLMQGKTSTTSQHRQWMMNAEQKPLLSYCQLAGRYAVRAVFENAAIPSTGAFDELEKQLDQWHKNDFVGLDPSVDVNSSAEWDKAVRHKRKTLFGVSKDKNGGSLYARVMHLGMQRVALGELNSEVVRGIWANLSFELLYMTNDDDERNSLQAHEGLFRNIITQAADPPLGYPVWCSTGQIDQAGISSATRFIHSIWTSLVNRFHATTLKRRKTKQQRKRVAPLRTLPADSPADLRPTELELDELCDALHDM